MKISDALRELATGANGFTRLFNRGRTYYELCEAMGESIELELFSELLYGCAKDKLVELINDAYNYKVYADEIADMLCSEGYGSESEVRDALDSFLLAFGFPDYRNADDATFGEVVLEDGENIRVLFSGEIYDGIPHGIGTKRTYRNGICV